MLLAAAARVILENQGASGSGVGGWSCYSRISVSSYVLPLQLYLALQYKQIQYRALSRLDVPSSELSYMGLSIL